MRISFQNSVLTLGLTSLFKDSASQTLVANCQSVDERCRPDPKLYDYIDTILETKSCGNERLKEIFSCLPGFKSDESFDHLFATDAVKSTIGIYPSKGDEIQNKQTTITTINQNIFFRGLSVSRSVFGQLQAYKPGDLLHWDSNQYVTTLCDELPFYAEIIPGFTSREILDCLIGTKACESYSFKEARDLYRLANTEEVLVQLEKQREYFMSLSDWELKQIEPSIHNFAVTFYLALRNSAIEMSARVASGEAQIHHSHPAVYLYIVVPKNYELQVDTVESGKWHDRKKIEAIIPSGTKLKVICQLSDDKDQNLLHMILAIDTERTNTSSHNCNSNEL